MERYETGVPPRYDYELEAIVEILITKDDPLSQLSTG